MKQFLHILFVLIFISEIKVESQTFVGTDELGRVLPLNAEVGNPKQGRTVAMFYFLWQGDEHSKTSPINWNLPDLINEHPEVLYDFSNKNWGSSPGFYYFWGESIYGYYSGSDDWVHLRNMQLLTDAGVDLLVLDATNRLIYVSQVRSLMKATHAIRIQGKKAPKIVFYTNTASGDAMQEIYDNFYSEKAPYKNEQDWFYLDGKPLIIGISEHAKGKDYETFFTIRESQWPNVEQKINGWPWIDFVRPQHVYYNQKGEKEIVNVSVSQHPNAFVGMGGSAFYGNKDNWGRSYRNGKHGDSSNDIKYGYNFQEQWDIALKEKPPFVFVTGWNEWIAGRWPSPDGDKQKSYFCDQANPEYSRDIEPTRTAGINDNYYLQLVANIRRYKGVHANQILSEKKTIKSFNDWKNIEPTYFDYIGDANNRNQKSALFNESYYINNTGRNDFKLAKVARDNKTIYFLVETTKNIILSDDEDWMSLYINTDRKYETGWNGFDFRVVCNGQLQCYKQDKWESVCNVKTQLEGNQYLIHIPLKKLHMNANHLSFEFKWNDNCFVNGVMDPMLWYVNGDTAPGARFNYLVITKR